MAITRSGESSLALQLELPGSQVPSETRREFRWLLGASLLAASSLALVLLAKTQDLAPLGARVSSGELVNLNTGDSASRLSTILPTVLLDAPNDLVSERVAAFIESRRPLPNVGALALLRLSKSEIENDVRWRAWQPRLAAAPKNAATISLLPMAKLKPLLVVRTAREFWRTCALWLFLYFAAFWGVHLIWRRRRFRGDPAILPALLLLTAIGLTLMLSLRDPLRDTLEFRKFAWGTIAGCALLLLPLFKAFQYRNFARWTNTPLFVALGLFLGLLRFGSGPTGSDARVNLAPDAAR